MRKDPAARASEDDVELEGRDLGLEAEEDVGDEEDEADEEPMGGRKHRWWSRRRDVYDEYEDADEEDTGPDWNAVVADSQAGGNWLDWSAPALPDEPPLKAEESSIHRPKSPEPDPDAASEWGPGPEAAEPTGAAAEWGPEPEPAEAAERADVAEPPEPAELADSAESPEPAEPAEPAQAAAEWGLEPEPAGGADTAEAAQPVGAADTAEAAEAGDPAETALSPLPGPDEIAVWETKPDPAPVADAPAAMAAATLATEGEDEPQVRYRSTPSWPPPSRPRIAAGIVCTLIAIVLVVLLVTNGYIGDKAQEASSNSPQARPALRTDPNSVPNDWILYRNSGIGFGLSYPPGWTVNEQGSVIEIRDPAANAGLRIEHRAPPGKTDPHEVFQDEERTASAKITDYRHLQLSAASYLGHDAALWEYTFSENGQFRHAADLSFVTKEDRFRMSFEAGSPDWERMLPIFQGFLSSFQPPK